MANSRCWHHSVIDPADNGLCTNCHIWDFKKGKCKDHAILVIPDEDAMKEEQRNDEIERLIRHNGYERRHGGIRQTRRG